MSVKKDANNRQSCRKKGNPLQGKYANYFKVGHNAYEFIIDFGQLYSETEEAELYSRIVTSPAYAKSLLKTLQDAIAQYERSYGKSQ